MFPVRRKISALLAGAALSIGALGCGTDFGEPGPSWRAFDLTFYASPPPQAAIVLVVDDRSGKSATDLRAGMGAAMRELGSDAVRAAAGTAPDWAAWHPIDVAVVIVPASAASLDTVISPAHDPRLAWTTNRATPNTAEDVALAVEEHVRHLAAPEGSPFQPLARAREVVDLLTSPFPSASAAKEALRAAVSPRAKRIAVAIVASTDDASPGPTKSHRLPPEITVIGLATSQRDPSDEADPLVYPRLVDWSDGMLGAPFPSNCDTDPRPPFLLFGRQCRGFGESPCLDYTIAESAPGLGRCLIQITTPEPVMCDPSRGWIDPLASNGMRRPRVTKKGERICEVSPVDASVMDACIHDERCTDCGAGWCVSEVPRAKECRGGALLPIRWAGGALPAPGTVHLTCLQKGAP
jgi:hypothetical protein